MPHARTISGTEHVWWQCFLFTRLKHEYLVWKAKCTLCLLRVEGRGSAVITDVIYSSETSSEEEKPSSQTKEKYETMKVVIHIKILVLMQTGLLLQY